MRVLTTVAVVLVAATMVRAAQMQPADYACPVCQTKFTLPVVKQQDPPAGMDSDFCVHTMGMSGVPYALVTCPRCNYTALSDSFNQTVTREVADKLLAVLAKSPYHGVENPFTEIPVWERARLGNECGRIKGMPASERLEFYLYAVYGLRIEATRVPDRLYRFPEDPISMERIIGALERMIRDEKDPAEQATKKVHMAMIAERAGLTRQRDEWVAKAKADAALGDAARRELERFTKLIALERTFQEEMLGIMAESMKEEGITVDRRNFTRYREADTLRRLGKLTEALAEFKAVRGVMEQTGAVRELCDHYIKMLEEPAAGK